MFNWKDLFCQLGRFSKEAFRFRVAASGIVKSSKVVEARQGVRVAITENIAAKRMSLHIQRLRCRVTASRFIKCGKVVQARQGVRVAITKDIALEF